MALHGAMRARVWPFARPARFRCFASLAALRGTGACAVPCGFIWLGEARAFSSVFARVWQRFCSVFIGKHSFAVAPLCLQFSARLPASFEFHRGY